jgi:hypothetical protein
MPAYVVAIGGPVHGDRLKGDADKTVQAFVGTGTRVMAWPTCGLDEGDRTGSANR